MRSKLIDAVVRNGYVKTNRYIYVLVRFSDHSEINRMELPRYRANHTPDDWKTVKVLSTKEK